MVMNTKKSEILVGLSGGIKSFIAAYILQKQGYKVKALAITNFSKDYHIFKLPRKRYGEIVDEKIDLYPKLLESFGFISSNVDLSNAIKFCKMLGIELIEHKAIEQYFDQVVDKCIEFKLTGNIFDYSLYLQNYLIEVLGEKADALNIKKIATGHFAKISFHEHSKVCLLGMGQERDKDQSRMLSLVNQRYLSMLELPLGEMNEVAVIKLSDKLKLKPQTSKDYNNDLKQFIIQLCERITPSKLRQPGRIIDVETGAVLKEHNGIYNYSIGDLIKFDQDLKTTRSMQVVRFEYHNGNIFVMPKKDSRTKRISLSCFVNLSDLCLKKPFNTYIKLIQSEELLHCVVYPKSANTLLIELTNPVNLPLGKGQIILLVNENQQILGRGKVQDIRIFSSISFIAEQKDEVENYLCRLLSPQNAKL